MSHYLTEEVYVEMSQLRTSYGYRIDDCIQPGIDNPERLSCGLVAGDEECYDVFAGIFDPVIAERHKTFFRGIRDHRRNMCADELKGTLFIYIIFYM